MLFKKKFFPFHIDIKTILGVNNQEIRLKVKLSNKIKMKSIYIYLYTLYIYRSTCPKTITNLFSQIEMCYFRTKQEQKFLINFYLIEHKLKRYTGQNKSNNNKI